jgi:16S rRNA (uracil1498-N3)-methyltransferase
MALPRFFAPALEAAGAEVTLPADEARHLTRVLRLGVGDELAVFDGRGSEFRARISSAGRHGVRVELVAPIVPATEPRVQITLAQAVLKGDRMDEVVRDGTMLGAVRIVPLVTSRAVVPARAARAGIERWSRVAIASAKQCGRAVVPAVSSPLTLAEWFENDRAEVRLWLVEPSAARTAEGPQKLRDVAAPASASLTVGPEGGWTDAEIVIAKQAGYRLTTFGRRTLRADAVALTALAIVGFLWD